ncbi:pyridoxal phosphate-dependent aminotransferase family protein [Dactylosporangium sp. AC04546]|uniref:aminotransferase class I/II-fold pyridoxal phosphate-dependent enzyme n=1 Tax=Dactylosporangium sp. AC04546 TaxID=2862460 RepID=UPI001EDCA44C|nr:pyridoxal phosphate-dependent aminotransferase family protein [Dactylosporangium sp. AC04546]WVK79716.1 pyridoxal phosphate-dependent aminotransferase family protein [Dactylosporangium sp. AC04546]
MTVEQLATAVDEDPRYSGIAHLREHTRFYDAVIDEIDGRRIRVGGHWLTDWASCNYLGFDLEPEIIDAVEPQLRRWGTHPSWSRMLGNPSLYPRIEERLAELLGAPDTLVLPTITQIHLSVIPALAGDGTLLVDARAHKTIWDGCVFARGQGATVRRFRSLDELASLLPAAKGPVLVCMDGVNSMTGNIPDLPRYLDLCRRHGAVLYVDDAHGFGVIGERRPDETSPYGARGNSIVRYHGESYDDLVLVGGFSKAYSSLLAFVAVPTVLKNRLKASAAPYLYSGPSPTASLATVLAGFDVNAERGDKLRADLHRMTMRVLGHVRGLGLFTPNTDDTPIIELPIALDRDLVEVSELLWARGLFVTLAPYPGVPRDQVGFRVQVTAANTDAEVDHLLDVLSELAAAEVFQSAREGSAS